MNQGNLKDSNPMLYSIRIIYSIALYSFISSRIRQQSPGVEKTHNPLTAIFLAIKPSITGLPECLLDLHHRQRAISKQSLRRNAEDPRVGRIRVEIHAFAGKRAEVLPLAAAAAGIGGSARIARPGGAGEVDGVGVRVHIHHGEVGGRVSGFGLKQVSG